MTLLTPLGLLGLLGIAVLILIYIIKPNYQQKLISSTYVWKLSLKYRKRRIPTSKLRNFLIILCQILILTSAAVILAQPNQILKAVVDQREVIIVIDSSASMRTEMSGVSRFERAVDQARELADEVFESEGMVSVIIADDKPEFLYSQRVTVENMDLLYDEMDKLIEGETQCSYGISDVNAAVMLSEDIVLDNPKARVHVFTDTSYEDGMIPDGVIVNNDVAVLGEEWNAAIINATAEMESNYYFFVIEIACYGGVDKDIEVTLDITNANAIDRNDPNGQSVSLTGSVLCNEESVKRLVFVNMDLYNDDPERFDSGYDAVSLITEENRVFSFQQIHVSIDESDNFTLDNSFDIYNGLKEVVSVQYASAMPNPFFSGILASVRKEQKEKWDVKVTEVKQGEDPALEGYNLYIFEHEMPEVLPTDGVVLLVNPTSRSENSDITIRDDKDFKGAAMSLAESEPHPITQRVNADKIELTMYKQIVYSGAYKTLLTCAGEPVMSLLDEESRKILVMGFSLHFSNLATQFKEFSILMNNVFNYFFPKAINASSYEVYQQFSITGRGSSVYLSGYEVDEEFTQFPALTSIQYPGTYALTIANPFGGNEIVENIFVKIPASESNVFAGGEVIESPFVRVDKTQFYKDLLMYIALAMVLILFIEWLLSGKRDSM